MVFHNRVFSSRRKIDLKKLAPYALHLVMVVAVAIYVFFGALAIRELEAIRVENVSLSRERRSASEEETELQRSRSCVQSAFERVANATDCKPGRTNPALLALVDLCYLDDLRRLHESVKRRRSPSEGGGQEIHVKQEERLDTKGDWYYWRFSDSILFCFTVITTIGYGNVAPKTTMGRLFVIFYGLVGVPFTMLAIANLGKFLAELLKSWTRPLIDCISTIYIALHEVKFRRRLQPKTSSKEKERLVEENGDAIATNNNTKESIDEPSSPISKKSSEEEEEDTGPVETSAEALMLFVAFILYIVMGSLVIGLYEPEMDFFMAIYFNFVTLTTIGLGDLVPKSESYLLVTLVYCAVGLALTTIAIEIAADYLKKLHYFGRKIENVQNVQIWFGGKKLTMKQLVKNLGDQFNIPIEEMQDLNLDHFVDQAIKVEAGELPTLRAATPNLKTFWGAIDTASMAYADEDDLITIQSNRKGSSLFVPTLPPPALDG